MKSKKDNQKQKILIIGSGGREHAVGWKIAQSPRAGQIFFAPGNAGTEKMGINVDIKATEISKLIEFAQKEKIDLTLALPDDPLALGIVNQFKEAGLRIWGPTKEASELEWSKAFAKKFMTKYGIPTARFKNFHDYEQAKRSLTTERFPLVIKASGLALGKGVIICENKSEAEQALENLMIKKVFGEAGSEVIIEEYLSGTEISIHAFSDGKSWKILPPAQDHKRVGEGDEGPNTGGMGTISPLPFVSSELMTKIEEEIVAKVILGMSNENSSFVGCLFPGLMITEDGPKVLEFNTRLGDPETQVYMRLLETDLLEIVDACIDGTLSEQEIKLKQNLSACNIVLASGGYPGDYEKGKVINGIGGAEIDPEVIVFHAGTTIHEGKLVTNGGRVLGISATGSTLESALTKAYKAIDKISFEGMQYRRDIGKSALKLIK